jgi:hypothetical protein
MARPSRLASIPTATLHAELRRREGLASRLASMRERLHAKVVALEARIADWGSSAADALSQRRGRRGGRRRARNSASLADVLAGALKDKTMSVSEAMDAAVKAGYRTNSRHFRTQVNIALLNKDRFKRVSRGRYTAR